MEEGKEEIQKEVPPNTLEIKEPEFTMGPFTLSSPFGIGTWAWGDSRTWGFNTYDKSFTEKTVEEAFDFLSKSGLVSLWDTAEIYGSGKSETIVGNLVSKFKEDAKGPLVIATKFLPFPWRLTHNSLRSALLESLKRLQLKSVDLYQIHGLAPSLRSAETWAEALAAVHKEGLIKAVGVSNYSISQLQRTHAVLAKYGIPLVSNQIEFSLLRNNAEMNGMLKTCKELGITIIAYSPLAMGRLSGKYSKTNPPKGSRTFSNYPMEEIEPLLEKLREIGKAYGKTPSQVALNWCICKGTVPIVGVKNKQQAEENMKALGWRLSENDVAQLDKLTRQQSGFQPWQQDK